MSERMSGLETKQRRIAERRAEKRNKEGRRRGLSAVEAELQAVTASPAETPTTDDVGTEAPARKGKKGRKRENERLEAAALAEKAKQTSTELQPAQPQDQSTEPSFDTAEPAPAVSAKNAREAAEAAWNAMAQKNEREPAMRKAGDTVEIEDHELESIEEPTPHQATKEAYEPRPRRRTIDIADLKKGSPDNAYPGVEHLQITSTEDPSTPSRPKARIITDDFLKTRNFFNATDTARKEVIDFQALKKEVLAHFINATSLREYLTYVKGYKGESGDFQLPWGKTLFQEGIHSNDSEDFIHELLPTINREVKIRTDAAVQKTAKIIDQLFRVDQSQDPSDDLDASFVKNKELLDYIAYLKKAGDQMSQDNSLAADSIKLPDGETMLSSFDITQKSALLALIDTLKQKAKERIAQSEKQAASIAASEIIAAFSESSKKSYEDTQKELKEYATSLEKETKGLRLPSSRKTLDEAHILDKKQISQILQAISVELDRREQEHDQKERTEGEQAEVTVRNKILNQYGLQPKGSHEEAINKLEQFIEYLKVRKPEEAVLLDDNKKTLKEYGIKNTELKELLVQSLQLELDRQRYMLHMTKEQVKELELQRTQVRDVSAKIKFHGKMDQDVKKIKAKNDVYHKIEAAKAERDTFKFALASREEKLTLGDRVRNFFRGNKDSEAVVLKKEIELRETRIRELQRKLRDL